MVLFGRAEYLFDGVTTYGLVQVEQISPALCMVARAVIYASAAFALAHVLGFCALRLSDLKMVFLPLGETEYSAHCLPTLCKSVAAIAVASLCLVLLFVWADGEAGKARQADGFAAFDAKVHENVRVTAYEFDGKYYDAKAIENMVDEALQHDEASKKRLDELSDNIADFYDTCLVNVESFLNWYYGLVPKAQRAIWSEDAEATQQRYSAFLRNGVDEEKLRSDIAEFNDIRSTLLESVKQELAESHGYGISEWVLTEKHSISEFPGLKSVNYESILRTPQGEFSNREEHKQSVIQAIQDSRAEMLALVQ